MRKVWTFSVVAACALATAALAAPPIIPVSAPTAMVLPEGYRLGAGDKLRVITFGEETLSGEFFVNDAGDVSLPLIGSVQAAGLTISEFQDRVQVALADGYMRDPRVSVEVENYRPFYILGEVNKPGEYPFSAGLTVMNAVATASGFTYRANTRRVFIKGVHDASEHPAQINAQTRVYPGDTIRVGERFF